MYYFSNKFLYVYELHTCTALVGNGSEANKNSSYPMEASLAQPSGLSIDTINKMCMFVCCFCCVFRSQLTGLSSMVLIWVAGARCNTSTTGWRGRGVNRRPLSPWATPLPLSYPVGESSCIRQLNLIDEQVKGLAGGSVDPKLRAKVDWKVDTFI